MLLQRDAYTHTESFYTQILVYRDDFTQRNFTHTHTDATTNRGAFTKECAYVYATNFYIPMFILCVISDGGHAFRAKEFRKQMQNRNFTDRNAVRAKGLHEHKHN